MAEEALRAGWQGNQRWVGTSTHWSVCFGLFFFILRVHREGTPSRIIPYLKECWEIRRGKHTWAINGTILKKTDVDNSRTETHPLLNNLFWQDVLYTALFTSVLQCHMSKPLKEFKNEWQDFKECTVVACNSPGVRMRALRRKTPPEWDTTNHHTTSINESELESHYRHSRAWEATWLQPELQ